MRTILALALACTVTAAGAAEPTVKQLLVAERQANSECRGLPPDERDLACSRRDRLVGRLSQVGYCFGRNGQIEADKEWHPCGPNSIRIDDLKPN